jgi:hypothetical protein
MWVSNADRLKIGALGVSMVSCTIGAQSFSPYRFYPLDEPHRGLHQSFLLYEQAFRRNR